MKEPAPFRRRTWLRAVLFLASAGAVGVLAFAQPAPRRLVLAALEADQAASLCARSGGYPLSDFWDRAKTMGVGAAVVRPRALSYFIEQGRVVGFSRHEIEKWKAVGLVSPSVNLRANAFWTKEPALASAIAQAAARQALPVSTSTSSGYHVILFQDAPEAGALGVYDPGPMEILEGRKLVLIFAAAADQDWRRPAGLNWRADGSAAGLWGERAQEAQRRVWPRAYRLGGGTAALLRNVYGQAERLLVIDLLPSEGVERNLDMLRQSLRLLSARGLPLSGPVEPAPMTAPLAPLQSRLVRLLVWVFGLFGPLLAARAGLLGLKRTRVILLESWPVASPVLQLIIGMLAACAAAAVMGLAAEACFKAGAGPVTARWLRWTTLGPLAIAALTLYTIDWDEWRRALAGPITYDAALKAAGLAIFAALLLKPRAVFSCLGLWPWAAKLAAYPGDLFWWLPWRWREIVVGFPCFLHTLFLVNWRMDCPDCESMDKGLLMDPRTWFLPGLFGPIGVITALSSGEVPRELSLAQTAYALLLGAAIGSATIAARLWRLHRSKGPKDNRTIVPQAQV